MSTTNYPKKIRLLRDKYPCVKGDIYTLKFKLFKKDYDNDTWELFNISETDDVSTYIYSEPWYFPELEERWESVGEIPADDYAKKDWFQPVTDEETPLDMLNPLVETALKVLDDGAKQLKGLKDQGWEEFKKRMKKIIEEDEKKKVINDLTGIK